MMLTALYNFAKREGLLDDGDYEPRRVDIVIKLKRDGSYLSLVETPDRGLTLRVPRLETRTVAISPGFIVDNAKYVLGIAGSDASPKDRERASRCNGAFQEQLGQALVGTRDVALEAVAAFENDLPANLIRVLGDRAAASWTGGENIAFEVEGAWAHESDGARHAWSAMRQASTSSLGAVRCLVTGRVSPPELKHPPIKRMPGTQQAQTMLVSFNSPAFTSMNFEQAQNASVSREGAEGYVTALNHLLRKDPASERRFAGGVGLGNDTVVLVWTKEKAPELESLLDLFDARTAATGLSTVAAPQTGLAPSAADATDFYAVTVGGNASRVVVRDWFQSKFGVVKTNVRRWFDDLNIIGQMRPPAIWQLLSALDPPGNASTPPMIGAALGRAALFGGRVPPEVLRHALLRLRVPPKPAERQVLSQRIALIKLTLIRTFNKEIAVALDEDKKDVPYLLGRLFAVLERLQGEALGDINATIRDRYFGAASSTPANVFPRLLRLSVHHVSKSGADWLEKRKAQIVDALPPERFPQILSLEDQGLFAVGYYQQREHFFIKRSVNTTSSETTTDTKESNL